MKVQSVGNYDCQRKNEVNFKTLSAVEKAQSIRNGGYIERRFMDLLRNPVKVSADFAWTFVNEFIASLTRFIN